MSKTGQPRRFLSVVLLVVASMLGLSFFMSPLSNLHAQENKSQGPPPSPEKAEVRIAQTAEEHEAKADLYQKKILEYRKEVEEHRLMLARYKKQVAQNPKQPFEDSYLKKMRLHCEKYINAAEALIREAEKMSEFHRLRAAETRGE